MPLVRSALAAAGSVPCQSHSLTKSRGRFWGEHRYICCAWTWLVKVSWRVAQVVEHEGKRDAAGDRASSDIQVHSTLNLHRRHLIELALFGSGCYAPP